MTHFLKKYVTCDAFYVTGTAKSVTHSRLSDAFMTHFNGDASQELSFDFSALAQPMT
jgi:hypothetical protein